MTKIFLETARLLVKIPTSDDEKNWVDIQSESTQFDKRKPREILRNDILYHQKYGFGMCSVYEKNTHAFIGRVGLFYFDNENPQSDIELGFALLKSEWNKGYATELAISLIHWAFKNLSVNKIIAIVGFDNKNSQRVLEKTGMLKIGQLGNEEYFLFEKYNQE